MALFALPVLDFRKLKARTVVEVQQHLLQELLTNEQQAGQEGSDFSLAGALA